VVCTVPSILCEETTQCHAVFKNVNPHKLRDPLVLSDSTVSAVCVSSNHEAVFLCWKNKDC